MIRFNKQASIMTFVAGILIYVIAVLISRFQYQPELPVMGVLLYAILTLIASIVTGLIVPVTVRKRRRLKNGRKKTGKA